MSEAVVLLVELCYSFLAVEMIGAKSEGGMQGQKFTDF
jgi:hypothetical protein